MNNVLKVAAVGVVLTITAGTIVTANAQIQVQRPVPQIMEQASKTNNIRVSNRYDSTEDEAFKSFFDDNSAAINDRDVIIDEGTELSFQTRKDSQIIIFLQGGELTTTLNGLKREREEGESWVIGPGTSVVLEAGDDSASLNWLEISTGY